VISRILYDALLLVHLLSVVIALSFFLRARSRPSTETLILRLPEVLFSLSAVFFLFTFIYATNANMDYVQRFMASHDNLLMAPNSTQERRAAYLHFLPLLAFDAAWYILVRIRPRKESWVSTWALPLAIGSGILNALAFPSFLRTAGLPILGWLCLVPLLLSLAEASPGWGIFYGTLAGVLQTMISNYWLGTFNLLTLQFVSVVTALEYVPFMAAALLIFRRAGKLGFLVFPAAWTVFDWLRGMGFLGYPWGMLGASQYSVIPLIQISSLTGVWGVTFLVTLSNSVLAEYARAVTVRGNRPGPVPVIALGASLAFCLAWAGIGAASDAARARLPARSVRLALVQQNDDPRKDDYRAVFDTLRRLTDSALAAHPDMVVWSETAFVPNIRRWSREDPKEYPLAALVRDFLAYQKGIRTWLLTGNDDYSLVMRDGVQERLDYNGSVLFSPEGERIETYHKIHLVPFTEYFPYKKELPAVYALLQSFDAYLWEPGDRRVVFRHPKLSWSTPICFEDVFPDDVRRFVTAGAEVILNLSNDYWSLTETEGMQHAANAIFRAVENGRPLARAAASGLTCLVDPRGRIRARAPFYKEEYLIIDIPLPVARTTLYTRWGDWFPIALGGALLFLFIGGSLRQRPR
jgi:apolipoprotein N-acyltransferase